MAVVACVSCADYKLEPKQQDAANTGGEGSAPPPSLNTPEGEAPVAENPNTEKPQPNHGQPESSSPHDPENGVTQSFGANDLIEMGQLVVARFERIAVETDTLVAYKTWRSESFLWASVLYKDVNLAEKRMYLACHNHSGVNGVVSIFCHKKNQAGPGEPGTPL